jgi:predicted GNAT family N-acyltransferase
MVYGPNPFVHHSNCLYNPTNSKNIDTHNTTGKREKKKILWIAYRVQREKEQEEKQELGRED